MSVTLNIDNSLANGGLADGAAANYYTGSFGCEIWIFDGVLTSAQINSILGGHDPGAYGCSKELTLTVQQCSAGEIPCGSHTLPDAVGTFALIGRFWEGPVTSFGTAVAMGVKVGVGLSTGQQDNGDLSDMFANDIVMAAPASAPAVPTDAALLRLRPPGSRFPGLPHPGEHVTTSTATQATRTSGATQLHGASGPVSEPYDDTTAATLTPYWYFVSALNTGGKSAYSTPGASGGTTSTHTICWSPVVDTSLNTQGNYFDYTGGTIGRGDRPRADQRRQPEHHRIGLADGGFFRRDHAGESGSDDIYRHYAGRRA